MPKMGEGYLPLLYIPDGAGRYIKSPVLTTTQRDALTAVEGMLIFNTTTGTFQVYDGSSWAEPGAAAVAVHAALTATHGVSGTIADADDLTDHEADYNLHNKIIFKDADNTPVNNSTTLVNDSELLTAIAANEEWAFYFCAKYVSHASADFKFGLAVPSGATLHWVAQYLTFNTAIGMSEMTSGSLVAWGYGVASIATVILVGYCRNGATAGNIQFQFAQSTAHASDTTTKDSSWARLTKLK